MRDETMTDDAPDPGGASRQLPHLSNDGRGVNHAAMRGPLDAPDWPGGSLATDPLRAWMRRLADRLRWVRILNGNWSRLCTHGALKTLSVRSKGTGGTHGMAGVFLDPPYADTADRGADLYAVDSLSVAHDVREWCLCNTDTPWLRIVLAGFEGEHDVDGQDALVAAGWRCVEWYTRGHLTGGMGNLGGGGQMHRDRLWLSPQCLDPFAVDDDDTGSDPATATALPPGVLDGQLALFEGATP